MENWPEPLESGGVPPDRASRAEAIAGLCEALRSPDPVLRDERAYTLLASWIPELDPRERRVLGDTMAARFCDPEIQARTFAPLILAEIVSQGDYDPAWQSAFSDWYPAETDLRGYDPELGWLHAVAHGADLLSVFGRHPDVDPAPLLGLAAARLLAPTTYLFAHGEDDRLGFAAGQILTRRELTEEQAVGWLDPIAATLRACPPGPAPAPAFVANTVRTLRVAYQPRSHPAASGGDLAVAAVTYRRRMPELIAPAVCFHAAWLEAHDEWGPGLHEDGFGLHPSDDVRSPAGFAAWVARLVAESDTAKPACEGQVQCIYRWIVEDGRVLGGIALRHGLSDFVLRAGHVGYGIRPSARRRGLATWALGRVLDEARDLGLDGVLIVCAADNVASAKTIEHHGGVLEEIRDTEIGPVRRYWVQI